MKISEEARLAAKKFDGYLDPDSRPDSLLELEEYIQIAINNASKPLVEALEAIGSDSQVKVGVPTTAGRLAAQLVACNSTVAKALTTFRAERLSYAAQS